MSNEALRSVTHDETWSKKRPCVAHMHVFGSLAYAMILNEKRGKLYAKDIICVFIAYCKGMKTYKSMYENKIKIKNRDVVFMEDNGNIRNDVEMLSNSGGGG